MNSKPIVPIVPIVLTLVVASVSGCSERASTETKVIERVSSPAPTLTATAPKPHEAPAEATVEALADPSEPELAPNEEPNEEPSDDKDVTFEPEATQHDVFEHSGIKKLVDMAMNG